MHNKFHRMKIFVALYLLFICLVIDSRPIFAIQEPKPIDEVIDEMTEQIVENMKTEKKQEIAIIDSSGLEGQTTDLNRYLSEELSTRLLKTTKFEIIERQFLDKVLAELKLSWTGIFDQQTIKDLGQILGVDGIITLTITDFGPNLKVDTRIISIETGEIYGVASTYIMKDKKALKLIGQKLSGKLRVFTYPTGVNILVDNELKGLSGKDGTVIEIPPGPHTVILRMKGFEDFGKKLVIEEDKTEVLKVKFKSNAFIRGCSTGLVSMIIPPVLGIPGVEPIPIYANGPGKIARFCGTAFYVSAAFYLIDRLTKQTNFLSKEEDDKYNNIVKKELYTTGSFYIGSVFFSTLAGIKYGRTEKAGIEMSFNLSDDTFGANLAYRFK